MVVVEKNSCLTIRKLYDDIGVYVELAKTIDNKIY